MARTWLLSGRGIARKVKNVNRFSKYQIKELGIEAHRECPNCKHIIDNSDVSLEWPGLPAGVKFDPTDVELLEHLAGKIGLANTKPHLFIDEFIPTIEDDQGICYAHPKNLPGVKQDGSSIHFFHRISNAYATGHRKRRKIGECSSKSNERVRWHKTGKTKPVAVNGVHKGWKKIMVLYSNLNKDCKPDKSGWVMHQYHLGVDEEENNGELVISKIFYQQNVKHMDISHAEQANEADSHILTVSPSPKTPKTVTPVPPSPKKLSPPSGALKYNPQIEFHPEIELTPPVAPLEDDGINCLWLAGESKTVEELDPNPVEEALFCDEVLDNFVHTNDASISLAYSDLSHERNAVPMFPELDNIPIDTPPDIDLSDLQFGSQDSISSWLDRL